jgi:uncharacterized protein YkwD
VAPGPPAASAPSGPPFREDTASPRATTVPPRDAPFYASCGQADDALVRAATAAAERQLEQESLFAPDELAFALRRAGSPHVWPRGWSLQASAEDDPDVAGRIDRWAKGQNPQGERRCGIGHATRADGMTVVAAVAVDALADLDSLPTTARVGQWLTLGGRMRVPTREVKVVLLGPRGGPKTVPSSLDGERIRSTFPVDQPGLWLVQVLATVATGPRPVLEAHVYVGTTPPTAFVRTPAPGEEAALGEGSEPERLLRMMNAARKSEGLGPLARDGVLERLAREHAENMRKAGLLGHDVGEGGLRQRLDAAGAKEHLVGENVASATSIERAHRSIWASPSHRANLLHAEFRRAGVAVVRDDEGTAWVAEVFAD